MSRTSDPVDVALESLRVHGVSPRDSLSQDLEQKLMDADRRSPAKASWLVKSLIAAAILTVGGVGYAAVEGRWWDSVMFYIEDDGVVTNERGDVIGETIQNEDGTFSTIIETGENNIIPIGDNRGVMTSEMTITTEAPLNGKSIGLGTVQNSDGSLTIIASGRPEQTAPQGDE